MVFRSHAGQVWRAVLVMAAGRREVADEATFEAFARLLDHREGVRDPVAWVFRTAFRLGAAELRREQSTAGDLPEIAAAASGWSLQLGEALQRLSPEQRIAVFLHYYADMPVREVSRLCDTTPTAIRLRLHRARKTLRTMLEQEEAQRYA
jgi:RNA polymerase sigma-70 factor, ECF subfamily